MLTLSARFLKAGNPHLAAGAMEEATKAMRRELAPMIDAIERLSNVPTVKVKRANF
jgi:hypothetical protein